MSDIIIGKHTLESLTSGMYSDPYVVFREYIQNSVDSIDEAIQNGILNFGEEQVVVRLDSTENKIIIVDNGLGIPEAYVESTLISIGNSKKASDNARGFRGIGRLAALSYCKTLSFKTSFKGETVATQITIDALKLSEILADNSRDNVTITDVLESVYKLSIIEEAEEQHYFSVCLEGVDVNSGLLSHERVVEYLSQNAPVPYNPNFVWGEEIIRRLKKEGLKIDSYNIRVEYGNRNINIYKPYKDEFVVDKGKNIIDIVQDIEIIKIPNGSDNFAAIGWVARTNYRGSIYEKSIKGIRLRKGNILIGDHQTLNIIFKDARFNGWSIGEIFAIDKMLVPNARRDNFEKNSAYFSLFEQLTTLAVGITRDIRTASLKRNVKLSNAIEQLDLTAKQANNAINEGISGNQKGIITKKLKEAQSAVSNSIIVAESEQYYKDIAFEELDMLIGKLKGTTRYKALNTLDMLSSTEKKILERVIYVVDNLEIQNTNDIIDAILNEFAS